MNNSPAEGLTLTLQPGVRSGGYQWLGTFSGTPTAGDTISIVISDVTFLNDQAIVAYQIQPGDTFSSVATGLANAIVNAQLSGLSAFQSGSNLVVFTNNGSVPRSTAFLVNVTGNTTENMAVGQASDENSTLTFSGSATTGDILSLTVSNPSLTGGQETLSHTVTSGETLSNLASDFVTLINADANLQATGITSRSSSAVVTVGQFPFYTTSTSGGATETITLGNSDRGNLTATIGGTPTTGDTVSIISHSGLLSGGSKTDTYTVVANDTLQSISQGLAAVMNGDSSLQTAGLSVANAAQLANTQTFSGSAVLPNGTSAVGASAVDGSSNSKTNVYQLGVTGGSSSTLTYDLNGNMTSDGTNSFAWDAENRLIRITYPGSGNFSSFVYDGLGRNVSIVETVAGSVTSTKQFVWCDRRRCEQRDASSAITAQFFRGGETISGTKYFFEKDHLGSIRELTDNTGAVQAEYRYDPFDASRS